MELFLWKPTMLRSQQRQNLKETSQTAIKHHNSQAQIVTLNVNLQLELVWHDAILLKRSKVTGYGYDLMLTEQE